MPCYKDKVMRRKCRNCGKVRLIHGQNLCTNCYHKLGVNSVIVACKGCGFNRPHYAKRMCKSCYNKKFIYRARGVADGKA
jgi:hypothetical protein